MNGSPFADMLFAFGSDDVIKGNNGNDELDGGANHDELTGGLGADRLTGGADSDTFFFTALTDSTKKASGRDTILAELNKAAGRVVAGLLAALAEVATTSTETLFGR